MANASSSTDDEAEFAAAADQAPAGVQFAAQPKATAASIAAAAVVDASGAFSCAFAAPPTG